DPEVLRVGGSDRYDRDSGHRVAVLRHVNLTGPELHSARKREDVGTTREVRGACFGDLDREGTRSAGARNRAHGGQKRKERGNEAGPFSHDAAVLTAKSLLSIIPGTAKRSFGSETPRLSGL